MSLNRPRVTLNGRRYLVLIGLALLVFGLGRVSAGETSSVSAQAYQRPEAETIATLTDELVSDPEFMPRKTFMQWLNGKLRKWDRPNLGLPEGIGKVVLFVVMLWCVLALLAILAHLGWTIWLWTRSAGGRTGAASDRDLPVDEITCSDRLWERSRELARSGAFREAIGVVLLALLRQLEAREIVSFHKSKTNGEYVAEYPSDLCGCKEFMKFIGAFERTIYGGLPVARPTYEAMASTAQRIIDDVAQDA